ncbi:MAG: transglutaminase-like domain-containing protein, partial [Methanobacteriaceae archaeon]
KNSANVKIIYSVKNPTNPQGNNLNNNISKKEINTLATNTANYIAKNKIAPTYTTSSVGKIQYQTVIYGFAKVLSFIKIQKVFPNYLTLNIKSTDTINNYIPVYSQSNPENSNPPNNNTNTPNKSVNSTNNTNNNNNTNTNTNSGTTIKLPLDSRVSTAYKGESLANYLKASPNCQSNDPTIINLAKSITAKSRNNGEKAVAIFNWVRDNVRYDYYYNTRKGAKGTLATRLGNCVDHTHLLIALCRSVGIAAKYINGAATFNSGTRYGHVWAQILVDRVWYVADAIGDRNSLGIINNWNTNTYSVSGYYHSISF